MKKIYIILFTILGIHFSFAQEETKVDENFPFSLLTRYFNYLNHGKEELKSYPVLNQSESYCIWGCIFLMESEDETIKKIAIARLKGIATQLFREGKPVLLTSGMNSANFNITKNANLEDDNNIIYVSIADCIVTQAQDKAQGIFNHQTRKLIEENK